MENYLNYTTTSALPSPQLKVNTGIYCLILIPIVLIALAILATVFYLKKRKHRSDELRHRLIPVYMYDPAEHDPDDLTYDSEQDVRSLHPDPGMRVPLRCADHHYADYAFFTHGHASLLLLPTTRQVRIVRKHHHPVHARRGVRNLQGPPWLPARHVRPRVRQAGSVRLPRVQVQARGRIQREPQLLLQRQVQLSTQVQGQPQTSAGDDPSARQRRPRVHHSHRATV